MTGESLACSWIHSDKAVSGQWFWGRYTVCGHLVTEMAVVEGGGGQPVWWGGDDLNRHVIPQIFLTLDLLQVSAVCMYHTLFLCCSGSPIRTVRIRNLHSIKDTWHVLFLKNLKIPENIEFIISFTLKHWIIIEWDIAF